VATGLRERKKQETRERIVREALALFAARGFDGTTVADIAAAADISPRTFFGYFPAKEDVVFHDAAVMHDGFAERLRERPAGENAFDALRAWVLDLDEQGWFDRPGEQERHALIRDTPALAARERALHGEFEALLAEAVAKDLGVERDSLRAHLVGAAAMAALEALGRWDEQQGGGKGHPDATAVLDEALTFLQAGLEALRRRPAS
jgi:AcrR family transcriptional regulator